MNDLPLTAEQAKELQEARTAAKAALLQGDVPFQDMTRITQRLIDATRPTYKCRAPYPHPWSEHRPDEFCVLPSDHRGPHSNGGDLPAWNDRDVPHASGTSPLDIAAFGGFPRVSLFFILDTSLPVQRSGLAMFWAMGARNGRTTNIRRALRISLEQAADYTMEAHDILVPESVVRDAAIHTVALVALETKGKVVIPKSRERGGMRACDKLGCGNYALYRFKMKATAAAFACGNLEHRPPLAASGRVMTQSGRGFLANGRLPR